MPVQLPTRRPQPAKFWLAAAGITQRVAAQHLGYAEPDLSRILNGFVEPGPRLRAALAELVGVDASELFDDVDEGVVA